MPTRDEHLMRETLRPVAELTSEEITRIRGHFHRLIDGIDDVEVLLAYYELVCLAVAPPGVSPLT